MLNAHPPEQPPTAPPEAVRGQGAQTAPLKRGRSLQMTSRLWDPTPPISRAELSKRLGSHTVPVCPGPGYKNTTRKQVLKESTLGLHSYTCRTRLRFLAVFKKS